ncbi:spore germination protein [Bacillus salipaludis]|uniref:Spore germination protein n=1 Tax=Bacillus salipaludis TaxID=2547811 RepID=A0AA90R772_9BACI|nr:spore germination protein [Bacillus salipaludis]MDQ6599351.1 spore germination protein [Bacillus salipaludis]
MFKWMTGKKTSEETKTHSLSVEELKEELKQELNACSDLTFRTLTKEGKKILFCYLSSLIDKNGLDQDILDPIIKSTQSKWTPESLAQILPIAQLSAVNKLKEVIQALIEGQIYIYIDGEPYGLLADAAKTVERSLEKAETESLVYGPKIAFTESLLGNINILRNNLKDPNLCMEDLTIGTRSKKQAKLVYIKGVADDENVNTFRQRINDLDIDHVADSTVLGQLLESNSWTVFPQLITTELPDRISIALLSGKVAVLMDRSPDALYGPTPFFTFFESTEDVYMRWNMGFFLRMLRLLATFLSVLLTPAYVSVLTYHYEVIPSPLLVSLGQSRSQVPFPPVFEALLLEFIIELLREAGARLPTKVGQTMGIVGGIVIGQAAVDAGFTSNILIIIIALSALGSFTTPSYLMGTAIRIIRFPIIIMAGLWGGIGIMVSFCFFLIHLIKLDTLGRPYLAPIYPFRWRDLGYSVFRIPPKYLPYRPVTNHPENPYRFPPKKAKRKKDVDE